ncbi:two-component regulator propeller domain-containing protein [Pedobacter metabolipauper]|uniref:two-component regulator propeller domain-containing protein n=1 Tax=Pedobacter metabolipauper TaxID=425513 RepID=UPI00105FC79E|nr:two-component regulator propeller domain-containing protein [Pedobacter metabolipauper]
MRKFSVFVFLLIVISSQLKAQSYNFRHYQVEQGLSYNSVFNILQDSKGFMWFATKDGLNRFDGYSFKIFRSNPSDPKALGSNVTTAVFEDTDGVLWVGTSKGLYRYNDTTEIFSPVTATLGTYVSKLKEDPDKNICFISDAKLFSYNKAKNTVRPYAKIQDFDVSAFIFTDDGTLWVSSRAGVLKRYHAVKDNFDSFDVFKNSAPVNAHYIDALYYTRSNSILIGTSHQGVKLFDLKTLSYKDILTFNPDNTSIYAKDFIHYGGDQYWIATESGIFVYHLKSGEYVNLKKNPNDPYAISDNAVYTFAKDREGGVWAGTYFGGVNYYPKPFTSFDKYFPNKGAGSLSGNAVREIKKDRYGNLWVATEDAGLNKLNLSTGKVTRFLPDGSAGSISHTNIHGLLAVNNELWIGTYEQGLDVMEISTGKVIRHYDKGKGVHQLKSNFIDCIYQTRNGEILLGSSYGLYRYNTQSDDFSQVPEFPLNFHYMSILEADDGTIWAGTINSGLVYYNPKTKEKGTYKSIQGKDNSISDDFINSLFIDDDKTLWVTTENGLNRFNTQEHTFKRYSTEDGFPSNVMYRVEQDLARNLWVSTTKGLVRFNPKNKHIKLYTTANGLLSDQFNYNSSFRDTSGKIFFGSVNGMIGFNPDSFIKNNIVPPVYITGFQVFNQELVIGAEDSPLKKSITFTDRIVLDHDQSTFSIDFAALGYTDYEMAEYAYKLEGVDQEYTHLKKNRKVFYTRLSPGTYTFLVKGANSSGTWNEDARKLVIEIRPPFWLSYWAYMVYVLFLSAAIYYVVAYLNRRTRIRHKRRMDELRNQAAHEIYEAKIEFFTQITHEIRTPLTLIKGPLETVINKYDPEPEVMGYLLTMEKNADRLLNLTNQLLDFRKIESKDYQLSLTQTNVSELIRDNFLRFRSAAKEKGIEFRIDLPDHPFYALADSEALNKIVSNLFSNAVKYAHRSVSVLLGMSKEEGVVVIAVKNDGYLIPEEMREQIFNSFFRLQETANEVGTGIGLALARSLTHLMGGSLALKPDTANLNVFELRLPAYHSNPTAEATEYTAEPLEHIAAGINKDLQAFKVEEPEDLPSSIVTTLDEKPLILLVDDNSEILRFLIKELSGRYTCITAANGAEALELIRQHAVHLIVSDVMMPVMDGFELCRTIKTDLNYSHVPIILLTAKSNHQSKIEGLETGADAYIEKPFSPAHLQAQINSLLSNRNHLKDYFARSPLVHLKSMAHSKPDELLLEKLNEFIQKNLSNTSMDVDQLAETLNMSRATFYRKIKSVSNLSPNELINISRLKKAAALLLESEYSIRQIAAMTGFTSQAQFSRSFSKQFGTTPSAYSNPKYGIE